MIKLLIDYKARIAEENIDKEHTPIQYAAEKNKWGCVIELAQLKENEMIKIGFPHLFALLLAIDNNQLFLAHFLSLMQDISIEVTFFDDDVRGRPLHMAIHNKNCQMLAALLSAENKIGFRKNNEGLTFEQYAKNKGLNDVLEEGFKIYNTIRQLPEKPRNYYFKECREKEWAMTLFVQMKRQSILISHNKIILPKEVSDIIWYFVFNGCIEKITNNDIQNKEADIDRISIEVFLANVTKFILDFKKSIWPKSQEALNLVKKLDELIFNVIGHKQNSITPISKAIFDYARIHLKPPSRTVNLLHNYSLFPFPNSSRFKQEPSKETNKVDNDKKVHIEEGWQLI